MIKPIVRLIQALQSNMDPKEIAAGAAYSLFLGFVPWNSSHIVILFLLLVVFKINRAAALVLLPLTKLIDALGAHLIAERIGYSLLTQFEALDVFWAWVTHAPILALMNFNHTRILGGLVVALILTPFVFILALRAVAAYRNGLKEKMGKWKVVVWFKSLSWVRIILKVWS